MDGHRFDAFVRAFASRVRTRRSLLKFGGGAFAALWAGASGARSYIARAAAAAKPIDIIAAAIQTTDPSLGGDWRIDRSSWSNKPATLTQLSPAITSALQAGSGVASGSVLTLALPGSNGKPKGLIKTVLLECKDEAAAQAFFANYTAATAGNVTPLDAAALLGESTDARIARIAKPDDPEFAANLPGTPAIETVYREGLTVGGKLFFGDDPALAATVSKRLIARLKTGATGHGLAGHLAFVDLGKPVTAWYSRLDGTEQRGFSTDDASFAALKLAEGDAIDFARTSQFIPTTEPTTFFRIHTWAGLHTSKKHAQAWVNGTRDRLTAQASGLQLVAIDVAKGLGDGSQGFLYTISDTAGVAIGGDLYVNVGANVFAVGVSAESTEMTQGMADLNTNPLSIGKAAQVILGAMLGQTDPPRLNPTPLPIHDVFGDSPLQPAPIQQSAGGTAKTTFTACTAPTPLCGKRDFQEQHRPYTVWCHPETKCTDAKCTCNLFRTKKKSTTAEWYGKQNERKEFDPDNYEYSCSCGTTAES